MKIIIQTARSRPLEEFFFYYVSSGKDPIKKSFEFLEAGLAYDIRWDTSCMPHASLKAMKELYLRYRWILAGARIFSKDSCDVAYRPCPSFGGNG